MHKLLVIASEHLIVPCILESCLPSSFIDVVNIITWNWSCMASSYVWTWGETMVISGGITASALYTKK
jgi:hypothetical protein